MLKIIPSPIGIFHAPSDAPCVSACRIGRACGSTGSHDHQDGPARTSGPIGLGVFRYAVASRSACDPKSFAPIQTLPAGTDADGSIADPSGKIVIVLDGDGHGATLIDAVARQVRATVKPDGAPEFAAADDAHHLYVNIAGSRKIAVLAMQAGRVTAYYPLPGCPSPHGLAIDAKTRRMTADLATAQPAPMDGRIHYKFRPGSVKLLFPDPAAN